MRRLVPILIAFFVLTPTAEAAWVWPVSGAIITPYRNGTDPYATGQHRGIDIAAPAGTPVVAAAGGEVRFAGTAGSSGMTIGIRTADGYDTSYLHLSSLAVRAGAHVSAGDRIGAVGTTGVRSAPAPHLHFGIRDAGTRHDYHDPLAFLPPPAAPSAPEAPPAAPAPAPQPAPPAAAPVTAPIAERAPSNRPGPRPHSRPRPHAAPRPHTAPRPHPRATPHTAPRSHPRATPHTGARRHPATGPARRPLAVQRTALHPQAHPAHGTWPQPQARSPTSHARAVPISRAMPDAVRPAFSATRTEHEVAGGPDLGWVLACAGLLLAAAVLGLSERGRPRTGTSGSRLFRALPLLSRR